MDMCLHDCQDTDLVRVDHYNVHGAAVHFPFSIFLDIIISEVVLLGLHGCIQVIFYRCVR